MTNPLLHLIASGAAIGLGLAGCASQGLERAAFRATASEPFFTVEVDGDSGTVETVDGDRRTMRVTRRVATSTGARIELSDGRGHAAVDLHDRACQDGMSGAGFPLTSRITIDGLANDGCARRLSDPPPSPM